MSKTLPSPFETPKNKLIIALDNIESIRKMRSLIEVTSPYAGWYKVGLETITAFGANLVIDVVKSFNAKVFSDVKFHDIPNTVAKATGKLGAFNSDMFNVHCSNGVTAMKAAAEKKGDSLILGVTVLTSHTDEECIHIFGDTVENKVLKFASDAVIAGLDGIVCSSKELQMLSKYDRFDKLYKITPGIQPAGMIKNDQQRVMTPAEAIKLGASALVIGRAITESENSRNTAKMILEEITEAMQTV